MAIETTETDVQSSPQLQLPSEITALRVMVEGVVKALGRLETQFDQIATLIDTKIHTLQLLQDEKFRSVQTQFAERDERFILQRRRDDQVFKDRDEVTSAIIGAAKDVNASAIAASETIITKQIDRIDRIESATGILTSKVDDLKPR